MSEPTEITPWKSAGKLAHFVASRGLLIAEVVVLALLGNKLALFGAAFLAMKVPAQATLLDYFKASTTWPVVLLIILMTIIYRHREAIDFLIRNLRYKYKEHELGAGQSPTPPETLAQVAAKAKDLTEEEKNLLGKFAPGLSVEEQLKEISFTNRGLDRDQKRIIASLIERGDKFISSKTINKGRLRSSVLSAYLTNLTEAGLLTASPEARRSYRLTDKGNAIAAYFNFDEDDDE